MTFRRKYIDLPTELCDKLATVCASLRISQRKFIETAVANEIEKSLGKQKGKRK